MSNKIISDYRSEALQGTIKLVDNKGNAKIFIASKPIMVSNQWIPQAKMPVKGDLITIEDKQYRVLKITNTIAEVLAMYNAATSQIFGSNNTYENSDLDKFCNNTFYNTLSSNIQNAIVEKTFVQDSWHYSYGATEPQINKYVGTMNSGGDYDVLLRSVTYGNSISRKCYSLSVQDVIDYLDVTTEMTITDTTLTSKNLWKMFWNNDISHANNNIFLRSADSASETIKVMIIFGNGYVTNNSCDAKNIYRPAFQIDLSKIEFVKN